jgi:hypothetical protein
MRTLEFCLKRGTAIALAALIALPVGMPATVFAQQTAASPPAAGASSAPPQSSDSNPSLEARPTGGSPADGAPAATQEPQTPESPKQEPTAPVGTAVAPYEKGIGVAASRPAGAVIAPAKQRRTRSFLIKSALVLGAAVAVGSVIGLSNASPSRPAGAR